MFTKMFTLWKTKAQWEINEIPRESCPYTTCVRLFSYSLCQSLHIAKTLSESIYFKQNVLMHICSGHSLAMRKMGLCVCVCVCVGGGGGCVRCHF